ncbi:hypothetical protein GQ55_6G295700 [Panicum hallii var. hallii]|uniref:ENTH domain-containing protein n=1 Tax=Panicum hallii var. hallii TaxID=1504633 RepID=A0A2T7DB14_9POAL|nr:hypothetical protein GQ55_6G295700 [Panicum hallii var. hallii]
MRGHGEDASPPGRPSTPPSIRPSLPASLSACTCICYRSNRSLGRIQARRTRKQSMAASTARWQLLAGEVKRQASGFLQDKYKQARLALGDVTPAELLVQEATNNDPCVPDAKTLACIADAAFDMDDYWRIAKVLHHRLGRAADWKQWRPVYKALVVLEFLLTHGPEDLPLEFRPDMPAMHDLRSFHYVDDKGFNWGACMQRRTDSILSLLTDADRLREARRRAIRVSHEVHTGFGFGFGSPTSSSSPSSASSSASSRTSRTWSFGGGSSHYSDSPTMCLSCASDTDYRQDKKCDAYTADDDCWAPSNKHTSKWWPATVDEDDGEDHQHLVDDAWDAHMGVDESGGGSYWSARLLGSLGSRASGFQSLSQPEQRRTTKKLQLQSQDY